MIFWMLGFGALGCVVSWTVIYFVERSTVLTGRNQTKQLHHIHTGFVPRIGGIGIAAAVIIGFFSAVIAAELPSANGPLYGVVLIGALAAFVLGFLDDRKPLGAKIKLLSQLLIAGGVYLLGLRIETLAIPGTEISLQHPAITGSVTVIWFVAMMNLINLIDGLDGLAGGITLMLMGLLAYLNFSTTSTFSPLFIMAIAGGILGFLFHNFPPAKVYMGDSGAYMLGFLIAAFSIISSEKGTIAAALIAPILALALPIADVSFAIIRRGLSGLPIFRPDRNHIHHRLLRTGLSARKTVITLYGVSLCALLFSLLNFAAQGRTMPIIYGFGFVIILFVFRGQQILVSTTAALSELTEGMNFRRDTRNALFLKNWLVVEAERADSGKNLWQDFKFVLKKMGFCRASLVIGDEERSFYVPNTAHDHVDSLFAVTHTLDAALPIRITLYGERDHLSERQFGLLADIAAETWLATAKKWEEVNTSPLNFHAIAASAESYRQQRNRSLYRPTY